MIDKDKIVLMTRMAVYDKRHGTADRVAFSYFRRDYIYRKNMWTRLCVMLGAALLLMLYWIYQVFVYGVDMQGIDVQQSAIDSVLFLLAIMAFYTFVGTIQATHQYHMVKKRMERYTAMVQKLERISNLHKKKSPSLIYGDAYKIRRDRV